MSGLDWVLSKIQKIPRNSFTVTRPVWNECTSSTEVYKCKFATSTCENILKIKYQLEASLFHYATIPSSNTTSQTNEADPTHMPFLQHGAG
jgi:hypothetical protein